MKSFITETKSLWFLHTLFMVTAEYGLSVKLQWCMVPFFTFVYKYCMTGKLQKVHNTIVCYYSFKTGLRYGDDVYSQNDYTSFMMSE